MEMVQMRTWLNEDSPAGHHFETTEGRRVSVERGRGERNRLLDDANGR